MKKHKYLLDFGVAIVVLAASFVPGKSRAAFWSCQLGLSSPHGSVIWVGDRATWTLTSNIMGGKSFWYGTKDGIVDVNNSDTTLGSYFTWQTDPYPTSTVGAYTRYITIRDSGGNTLCTTNTVSASVINQPAPTVSIYNLTDSSRNPIFWTGDFLRMAVNNLPANQIKTIESCHTYLGSSGCDIMQAPVDSNGTWRTEFQVLGISLGNWTRWVRVDGIASNLVSYTVVNAATAQNGTLSFSQNSFNFIYTQGGVTLPSQSLTFMNTSTVTVYFTINVANQPTWLNTGYATGQLAAYPGVPVGLGASVNPAGLIPGIYTTNVTLTGNFVGSPKVISVVLIVNPPTLPLTITTNSSLPSATVGTYYSLDIIPDGGLIRTNSGNVSWGIISGSLPSGLATGSGSSTCANVGCMGIGGTPTTASTYNFTLSVSDGASSVSKSFVLVVNPVFPSCTPPPSCPAPTGCTYTGKTTCSCGTLVCPTPTPTSTPTLTPIPTITSTKTYSLSEIYDGDLIRGQGDIAVWIVKTVGEKRYKRWLFGPQIFNAYGHLGFNKVKNVSKETLNHFDTSNLIRKDGDTKVYELTDFRPGISATRRWIPTAEIFLQRGFDFDSVYVVNQVEFNLYTEGSPLPITQSAPVDNASLTANMSEVMLKFLGLER